MTTKLLTDPVRLYNDFSILDMAVVVRRFANKIRRLVAKQTIETGKQSTVIKSSHTLFQTFA